MKLSIVCLLAVMTGSPMALSAAVQELRESPDPYFQTRSAPPRQERQSGSLKPQDIKRGSEFRATAKPQNDSSPDPRGDSGFQTFAGQTSVKQNPAAAGTTRVSTAAMPNASTAGKQESESTDTPNYYEPTRPLARVGTETIFVADLSVEAMQLIDKFMGNAPDSIKRREVATLIPRLLPKYIQSKVLLVDAIDGLPEGADIDDIYESAGKQFDEAMLPRLMENVKVESAAELDAYYRRLGSSLRSVRKSWIESELVRFTMQSKINSNPDVSHREMYEYYLANKEKYSKPARARWEQLMVRYDRFPTREAARAAITEMGREVLYGASLAAVAKRSSHGFKAEEGGQQGWTTRGSLVDKDLDQLLFTIEPGKLSEIIETRRGLAIVRVLEREEAGFVPFETAQAGIKETIRDEKREREFQEYVSRVRQRIPVEIFDTQRMAQNPDSRLR
jgi:parvulin-like peptidyl-prolyl isomerase